MIKMRNKNTVAGLAGAMVALAIIIPVLYGVVGGLASLSMRDNQAVPTSNPLAVSDYSHWKLYDDSEVGYRVKYPPELYVSKTPFSGFTTTFQLSALKDIAAQIPDDIEPRIQIFKSSSPVTLFVDEVNKSRNAEQFPEFTQININKKNAYQTKAIDPEVIFTHTIIGDENNSYLIELFTIEKENDALKEIYQKMLESFEIIQQ